MPRTVFVERSYLLNKPGQWCVGQAFQPVQVADWKVRPTTLRRYERSSENLGNHRSDGQQANRIGHPFGYAQDKLGTYDA